MSKVVYLHSCGDVQPIVGELIYMGVNMLQPIPWTATLQPALGSPGGRQPESMDIFALKREYGRHLCFAGGISTQQTLPPGLPRSRAGYGTPEQVRAEARRCGD